LIEVLVVLGSIVDLSSGGTGGEWEKVSSAQGRRRCSETTTHVELGLFELVVVDGFDLLELWWGKGKVISCEGERSRRRGAHLDVLSIAIPSETGGGERGDEGQSESASEHLEDFLRT
jgi:hypothetical protein